MSEKSPLPTDSTRMLQKPSSGPSQHAVKNWLAVMYHMLAEEADSLGIDSEPIRLLRYKRDDSDTLSRACVAAERIVARLQDDREAFDEFIAADPPTGTWDDRVNRCLNLEAGRIERAMVAVEVLHKAVAMAEDKRVHDRVRSQGRDPALDERIRAHVLANSKVYEQAGRVLDETYSPEYFWMQDVAFYKAQECWPQDCMPKRDEWKSVAKRMHRIVDELLDTYRFDKGFPIAETAKKIVLLHWILTDSGCNRDDVRLTELQDWSLDEVSHELGHAYAFDLSCRDGWRDFVAKAFAVVRDDIADEGDALREQPADDDPEWRTAAWFRKTYPQLNQSTLREAASRKRKTKRVRWREVGGAKEYSHADAVRHGIVHDELKQF